MEMETTDDVLRELQPSFPDVIALDEKADILINERDVFGALVCWERALFFRQHYLGFESREVWQQARKMCEFCTKEAATALSEGNLKAAHRLLLKADALSVDEDALRLDILNHFACYYRRVSPPKFRVAYEMLQKAMKIDRQLKQATHEKGAEIRLNACAILSLLGKHDKALELAQAALLLLQEDNMPQENDQPVTTDNFIAQAVAYHNIGVEEEFLNKSAQSLHSYRKAASLGLTHCGEKHPLTQALHQSLEAAENVFTTKKQNKALQEGRYVQVKAVYGNKSSKMTSPSKVSQSTLKAYKISTQGSSPEIPLAREMKPISIDISQFDDASLVDDFDTTKMLPSNGVSEGSKNPNLTGPISLLTPRQEILAAEAKEVDNRTAESQEYDNEDNSKHEEELIQMNENDIREGNDNLQEEEIKSESKVTTNEGQKETTNSETHSSDHESTKEDMEETLDDMTLHQKISKENDENDDENDDENGDENVDEIDDENGDENVDEIDDEIDDEKGDEKSDENDDENDDEKDDEKKELKD